MMASAVVYLGIGVAIGGLLAMIKPVLWLTTVPRCLTTAAGGLLVAGIGLVLPAPQLRATRADSRLDEFAPAWQFSESHRIRVEAPPERAYEAIRSVRADEIFLFNALLWIRRGGRPAPREVREAGEGASLIDVATGSTFFGLADDAPRELVIGTVVLAPPGQRGKSMVRAYRDPLPPGFALATMNFLVTADGSGSWVSTETRVFASDASSRRRFGAYWRLIYPGSALIRRMWLRAIKRRAEDPGEP